MLASGSFSICAYRRSVSIIDREAYAIGFHWESSSCSSTAPSPYEEASADIFVGASGSYRARTAGLESSSLTCANAHSWAGPHTQVLDLLSSSCNGCVSSASFGVNFPNWFTIPINCRSLEMSSGNSFV